MKQQSRSIARLARQSAMLVIAVSLLLIPVRCDASPLPHSIFVDPDVDNRSPRSQHLLHTPSRTSRTSPNHDEHLLIAANSASPSAHVHSFETTFKGVTVVSQRGTTGRPAGSTTGASGVLPPASSTGPCATAGAGCEAAAPETTGADSKSMQPVSAMVDAPYSISLPGLPGDGAIVVKREQRVTQRPNVPAGIAPAPLSPPPRAH